MWEGLLGILIKALIDSFGRAISDMVDRARAADAQRDAGRAEAEQAQAEASAQRQREIDDVADKPPDEDQVIKDLDEGNF